MGKLTINGFTAELSPEKFTITKQVKYDPNNRSNATQKQPRQYKGMELDKVSFDLIIDGTGQFHTKSFSEQKSKLIDETIKYESGNHRPPVCQITYSGLNSFKADLDQMTWDIYLFDKNGEPLRAKVSLSFTEHIEQSSRQQQSSPDMSHSKLVTITDHLPLMSEEVYDEPYYYVQLAKTNSLINFRKLKVGDRLTIPPLVNTK